MTTPNTGPETMAQVRQRASSHDGCPADIFDRALAAHDARTKRDAAREALDGLIAWHRESAQDPETPSPIRRGISVMADEAQRYRDTHYPEEATE